jgi:hypothetical protein
MTKNDHYLLIKKLRSGFKPINFSTTYLYLGINTECETNSAVELFTLILLTACLYPSHSVFYGIFFVTGLLNLTMKHIFTPLFFLPFFFYSLSYGQYISSATDLDPDCDTLRLRIVTSFPFGSGNTCPSLVSNTLSTANSAVTIGLTYDATGPWPANFCSTVDTIDFLLPPGANSILVKVYTVFDATVVTTSTTLATCITTGLEERNKPTPAFFISPNPATNHISIHTAGYERIESMRIFDIRGTVVLVNGEDKRELDISSLKAGLYFIEATINNSRSVQKFIHGN